MSRDFFISFWRGFIKFVSSLNALATFWIFAIMVLITCDVVGRGLFNHPLTGTPEFVKVSLVGIVFLQIPHTFWNNRHIRSTIIQMRVRPLTRTILDAAANVLGGAVFLGVFMASWTRALTAFRIKEFEGEVVRIPVYPIRIIILVGSAVAVLLFCARLIDNIRVARRHYSKGAE